MKQTEQTLLEQMRITELEISYRQNLLGFDEHDSLRLKLCRPLIESKIDVLVDQFYQQQARGDLELLGQVDGLKLQYTAITVSRHAEHDAVKLLIDEAR